MKYIFVDFDGVLTSVYTSPGSYLKYNPADYGISEVCFKCLISLCNRTGAKVIISSNWRKFPDDGYWTYNSEKYKNNLPELRNRLGDFYAGTLPVKPHMSKLEALDMWMSENECDGYVIFDDDENEGFHTSKYRDHYVKTNPNDGLTENDCFKAEAVLY